MGSEAVREVGSRVGRGSYGDPSVCPVSPNHRMSRVRMMWRTDRIEQKCYVGLTLLKDKLRDL